MLNNSGWNILEGIEPMNNDDAGEKKKPKPVGRSIDDIKKELAEAVAAESANNPDTEPKVATEGFDVIGTERELQKGKKSNSIGVNPLCRDCDMVSPVEGDSMFSNFFSVFQ